MSSRARDDRREFAARVAGWAALLWPALLIGALALAGAFVIANTVREREARALRVATLTASNVVLSEVQHRMLDQLHALERLAASWESRDGMPHAEFEAEAGRLARDLSSIQAIGWVDPDFHVRWIVPHAGNEAAKGVDLGFEARRREALESSRDERTPVVSRPIKLVQGGMGLIVYVPLYVDGRFDGFIGGVWRSGDLFSDLLRNAAPGFAIRILDDGELLYARDAERAEEWKGRIAHVPRFARPWSIEVAPLPATVATYRTQMPLAVMIACAALAIALSIAAHLARARRFRNRMLAAEIARREAAERVLVKVLEEVPDHVWSGELRSGHFDTTYYSPVAARITGYEFDQFNNRLDEWYKIVHEEDRAGLMRLHAEVLRGQRSSFETEYRLHRADGALRWIRERVHSTPTRGGLRLDGVTSDITESKRIEEERLQSAQERSLLLERERLTREMHDGLGGQLVTTISMLERGQSSQSDVAESLRRALDDMRIVIDSLDPATTDLTTSLGMLRSRLQPLLQRNGLELRWRVDDVPGLDDFPPEQSLHLLRIIQEAVTNAMVHAKASRVCVDLHACEPGSEMISVEIRDDGGGFQPERVSGGRGIRLMKTRARALGAELRIEEVEFGTVIAFRVAIPR